MSGTTACTVLIVGSTMFTANVGDSRAVVGRLDVTYSERKETAARKSFHWNAIRTTTDHKPDEEPEYSRIIANNGRVEPLKGRRVSYRPQGEPNWTNAGLAEGGRSAWSGYVKIVRR